MSDTASGLARELRRLRQENARFREALERHHQWSIGGVAGYRAGKAILFDLTEAALGTHDPEGFEPNAGMVPYPESPEGENDDPPDAP